MMNSVTTTCASEGVATAQRRANLYARPRPVQRAQSDIVIPAIEPGVPTVFSYDGTLEGLMTCIFIAYAAHCRPEDVLREKDLQMRLGQNVVAIETSMEAALRVRRGICRTCGDAVWHTVATASTSDAANTGTVIYEFVRYAMDAKKTASCSGCPRKSTCTVPCQNPRAGGVLDEWTNPVVEPVLKLERHVSNEVEKMKQFMRFEHVDGDLWYAKCNPNANVVPLVMEWFARRFNTQRFVIFDEAHALAGISSGGGWQLVATDHITPPEKSGEEATMQAAWKRFYDSLSIDARYNPELRRHFMPERLWKNITEMKPAAVFSTETPLPADKRITVA